MEIFISFIVGFIVSWFLIRTDDDVSKKISCPKKETIVKLAQENFGDKRMARELREYSLVQIQQGNYEYIDVLNTLKQKEKNDKA